MTKTENLTPIRFHFYSLKFTPYKDKEREYSSNTILKDIITYITVQKRDGKGHLIDRHHNRPQGERRELFMTSAIFMHRERRIRCSMALLRAGKKPKIKPVDKFKLIPISTLGTPAEETHFFIDFSRDHAVICLEYNYHGPRISDIEYYLRNVARDTLKLSKTTDVNLYMDTSIDDTLADFKNVLNMDIKINPSSFTQMDNRLVGSYFTHLNNIGNFLKPKFLKLEAMFQTPGRSIESSEINKEANNMFTDLLQTFRGRPFNIDCFDSFVVKYEDKEGQEEVFNLLKGKKEVIIEIDLNTITKRRQWYELIEKEFDEFINSL
ncbi:MAG: hypothetical protein P8H45_06505 [Flavobacteriaceae bacterium]|nr:hypothetical protein [Flavobacteriaceae bacterium]